MATAAEARAQLKELWDNAEQAAPQKGDTFIGHYGEGETNYSIGVARWELNPEQYRILERAKPKAPEWEAVVASYIHDEEHVRNVFARTEHGGWESHDYYLTADQLVDPVPLVELPEREEVLRAVVEGMKDWAFLGGDVADAVLELLRGERRA